MYRNYPGKKFLRKPILLNNQKCLGTNQGVFRKEKTKGYSNMNIGIGVTNVEEMVQRKLQSTCYTAIFI